MLRLHNTMNVRKGWRSSIGFRALSPGHCAGLSLGHGVHSMFHAGVHRPAGAGPIRPHTFRSASPGSQRVRGGQRPPKLGGGGGGNALHTHACTRARAPQDTPARSALLNAVSRSFHLPSCRPLLVGPWSPHPPPCAARALQRGFTADGRLCPNYRPPRVRRQGVGGHQTGAGHHVCNLTSIGWSRRCGAHRRERPCRACASCCGYPTEGGWVF